MLAIGTPLLAADTKIKNNLGSKEDEEDIVIGKYVIVEWKRHVINRWCRKMDQVVLNYLQSLAERKEINEINYVDVSVLIDYGKRFLRATPTIIVQADGNEKEFMENSSLASAKCKGDSYDILKNTFAAEINDAFQRIKDRDYKATVSAGEDGGSCARLSDQPDNMNDALVLQMKIESWIGCDLKFLMMATGREGAEGSWCFYCELMASEWKKQMSAAGKEWTN